MENKSWQGKKVEMKNKWEKNIWKEKGKRKKRRKRK